MFDIYELFEGIFTSDDHSLPEVKAIRTVLSKHSRLMILAHQRKEQVDEILAGDYAKVYPTGESTTGSVQVPRSIISQYMKEEKQDYIDRWKRAYDVVVAMAALANEYLEEVNGTAT